MLFCSSLFAPFLLHVCCVMSFFTRSVLCLTFQLCKRNFLTMLRFLAWLQAREQFKNWCQLRAAPHFHTTISRVSCFSVQHNHNGSSTRTDIFSSPLALLHAALCLRKEFQQHYPWFPKINVKKQKNCIIWRTAHLPTVK